MYMNALRRGCFNLRPCRQIIEANASSPFFIYSTDWCYRYV